jgi:hypothetical protein
MATPCKTLSPAASAAMNDAPHHLSRRAALAGLAIAVAPVAPAADKSLAAAGGGVDPILALIEQHKAAERDFGAKLDVIEKLEETLPQHLRRSWICDLLGAGIIATDDPRWIAAERASWDALRETERLAIALFDMQPLTVAGLVSLLHYAHQYEADGGEWSDNVVKAIEGLFQRNSLDDFVTLCTSLTTSVRLRAWMCREWQNRGLNPKAWDLVAGIKVDA